MRSPLPSVRIFCLPSKKAKLFITSSVNVTLTMWVKLSEVRIAQHVSCSIRRHTQIASSGHSLFSEFRTMRLAWIFPYFIKHLSLLYQHLFYHFKVLTKFIKSKRFNVDFPSYKFITFGLLGLFIFSIYIYIGVYFWTATYLFSLLERFSEYGYK